MIAWCTNLQMLSVKRLRLRFIHTVHWAFSPFLKGTFVRDKENTGHLSRSLLCSTNQLRHDHFLQESLFFLGCENNLLTLLWYNILSFGKKCIQYLVGVLEKNCENIFVSKNPGIYTQMPLRRSHLLYTFRNTQMFVRH